MLGRLRMSTQEALQEYEKCAAEVFSLKNLNLTSPIIKYRATGLQRVVEKLVEKCGMGHLMQDPSNPQKGKVMVCVMPANNCHDIRVIRSWTSSDKDTRWDKDITIWQAARAATATPTYFKPQVLGTGEDEQPYLDAAVWAYNPINYLLEEAAVHFGTAKPLGCVVSIGSGTRNIQIGNPQSGRFSGWIYPYSFFSEVFKLLRRAAADPEEAHRMLSFRLRSFPSSYYRFNVPGAADAVGSTQLEKIPKLKNMTTEYLSKPDIGRMIQEVASGLQEQAFDHGLSLGFIGTAAIAPLYLSHTVAVNANRVIAQVDKDLLPLRHDQAKPPRCPSPCFTGRKEILQKLDAFFAPRNSGGMPRREVLLYGMGGVGKSEIAFKIAEVLKSRYVLAPCNQLLRFLHSDVF